MNQAEIIAMATEAGLNSYRIAPSEAVAAWGRFAALVAAKEREACAKVCLELHSLDTPWGCAVAIRARDKKEAYE